MLPKCLRNGISRGIRLALSHDHRRVLFVGLDNSGKTTLIKYILKEISGQKAQICGQDGAPGGQPVSVGDLRPTTEFKIYVAKYKRWKLFLTDVGGSEKQRQFWRHHFTGIQGIVFVVDSGDLQRLKLARMEFSALLRDNQLLEVPFLVFFNKSDVNGLKKLEDLKSSFLLGNLTYVQNRQVNFVMCSGITGHGVLEGLNWLCTIMKAC